MGKGTAAPRSSDELDSDPDTPPNLTLVKGAKTRKRIVVCCGCNRQYDQIPFDTEAGIHQCVCGTRASGFFWTTTPV